MRVFREPKLQKVEIIKIVAPNLQLEHIQAEKPDKE